ELAVRTRLSAENHVARGQLAPRRRRLPSADEQGVRAVGARDDDFLSGRGMSDAVRVVTGPRRGDQNDDGEGQGQAFHVSASCATGAYRSGLTTAYRGCAPYARRQRPTQSIARLRLTPDSGEALTRLELMFERLEIPSIRLAHGLRDDQRVRSREPARVAAI